MGRKIWDFDVVYVFQDYDPQDPESPYIYFDLKEPELRFTFTRPQSQSLGIYPGEPAALALLTGDDLDLIGEE